MAKKSSTYWKKRFSDLEASQHHYAEQTFHDVQVPFDKAQAQIQAQIEAWYGRYATNNGISMTEARKQLSAAELKELQWDVQAYIKAGQENALDGRWMKELENASAKFHISRLEALKLRTQQQLELAFGNQLDSVDGMMKSLYQSGYYHTCFEVQKGFNIGWEIGEIDDKKLQKVISKPWAADGKNFSDRVWSQKTQMINDLHNQLTRTVIQGKAPDEAIKQLSKYVSDKTKNAKVAAGRLVMTESAFISAAAQEEAFKELDVEEFEIVATLDSHTSEICQEMDGQHFPMKDYEPGVTAPPFHPWCRSTTVPYFDDEFSLGERAARDENGQTYYVPSNMTYKDWSESFVQGKTEDLQKAEKLTNEEIDARVKDLKQKQSDLSGWGDYDEVVKDWGSVDDYFDEGDEETISVKKQFLKYQKEIESLQAQRTDDIIKSKTNAPVTVGGVDCNVYSGQFQFGNGTSNNTNKPRKAVTYETPDNTKFVFPNSYDTQKQGMTPEKAISLYQRVPQKLRELGQDTIEFVDYFNPQDKYWRKKYKNFTHSYATGGTGRITFYRHSVHNDDYVVRTYCHEIGHKIDVDLGVNSVRISQDTEWIAAMAADKTHSGLVSPTTYGANANTEDFAESIAEYVADPVGFKQKFPNRTKIIEKILTS